MTKTHFMTLLKELINFFKKNKSDSSGPGFITPILLGGKKKQVLYSVLKIKHSRRKNSRWHLSLHNSRNVKYLLYAASRIKRAPPPPAIEFDHTSLSAFLEKLSLSLYEAPLGVAGIITQA